MSNSSDKEYDRIAAEIRQDQAFRITLFTFSVTACAALLGLSEKIMLQNSAVLFCAIYVVLAPSIILVHHYTRSINSQSEYLRVFHGEKWMERFDMLTETTFSDDKELRRSHKFLQKCGLYTTGKALTAAYLLLIVFVVLFGTFQIQPKTLWSLSLLIGGGIFTSAVLFLFGPISKKEYKRLWDKVEKENESSLYAKGEVEPNNAFQPSAGNEFLNVPSVTSPAPTEPER